MKTLCISVEDRDENGVHRSERNLPWSDYQRLSLNFREMIISQMVYDCESELSKKIAESREKNLTAQEVGVRG